MSVKSAAIALQIPAYRSSCCQVATLFMLYQTYSGDIGKNTRYGGMFALYKGIRGLHLRLHFG